MADNTKIEWANASINPLGWGCYGPGGTAENPKRCSFCYAHRLAKRRLRECPQCQAFEPHWHPEELAKLQSWKRPRRVFVESMGDVFGEGVKDEHISRILWAIAGIWGPDGQVLLPERRHQHTGLILTKNPGRMRQFMDARYPRGFEIRNLWLGVSVTHQQDADERIPLLLQTPAAVRFVSAEPLLGPVDFDGFLPVYDYRPTYEYWQIAHPEMGTEPLRINKGIDWIILGQETGPGARPCEDEWVESLIEQCREASVPLFIKGKLAERYPIQQFPMAPATGKRSGNTPHEGEAEAGAKLVKDWPK